MCLLPSCSEIPDPGSAGGAGEENGVKIHFQESAPCSTSTGPAAGVEPWKWPSWGGEVTGVAVAVSQSNSQGVSDSKALS